MSCQKVSCRLYIASKSALDALCSVKCILDSLSVLSEVPSLEPGAEELDTLARGANLVAQIADVWPRSGGLPGCLGLLRLVQLLTAPMA